MSSLTYREINTYVSPKAGLLSQLIWCLSSFLCLSHSNKESQQPKPRAPPSSPVSWFAEHASSLLDPPVTGASWHENLHSGLWKTTQESALDGNPGGVLEAR